MKSANGLGTLLGLGLAGWLIYELTRSSSSDDNEKEPSPMPTTKREEAIAIIRAAARKVGLPEYVALATADVESHFDAGAQGDRKWHEKKGGELYIKNVRDNPRMKDNPARLDAEAWRSYGLFQLLAAFFVEPTEHPTVLLDPHLNAERGVRLLKRLYDKYDGDTDKIRIHYGAGNLNVSEETKAQLLSRFQPALEKWKADAGEGVA